MKKALKFILAALVILAGAAAFVVGRYYIDNKKPNFTEEYVLYVRPETTLGQIADSLQSGAGMIRPKSLERVFKKSTGNGRSLAADKRIEVHDKTHVSTAVTAECAGGISFIVEIDYLIFIFITDVDMAQDK